MNDALYIEKEWLPLFMRGNERAFTVIYEHYSPILLHKLSRLVGDEEVVLDIHQMTFIRFWEYREQIQEDKGVSALLFRIARNLVVDYYRKSATEESLKKAFITQATIFYDIEEPTDEIENMSESLNVAISKLPAKRREVFLQCKFQGMTYEQVAAKQGVSLGTVKDHMAKAMRFLKKEMGDGFFMVLLIFSAMTR